MWAAIVALEERLELIERMTKRAERLGPPQRLDRYRRQAADTAKTVLFLRQTIERLADAPGAEDEGAIGAGTAT